MCSGRTSSFQTRRTFCRTPSQATGGRQHQQSLDLSPPCRQHMQPYCLFSVIVCHSYANKFLMRRSPAEAEQFQSNGQCGEKGWHLSVTENQNGPLCRQGFEGVLQISTSTTRKRRRALFSSLIFNVNVPSPESVRGNPRLSVQYQQQGS